jgi:hypothetical protein
VLPATHREIVFDWLRLMPAFKDVECATALIVIEAALARRTMRETNPA